MEKETIPEYTKVIKQYSELDITNRFIFGKVMRDSKLCKPLLETILQVKIRKIIYLDYEKTIEPSISQKGIRLDIYIDDGDNTVYNLEMQVENEHNLPFRTRYYQGIIDLNLLEKGMAYDTIKMSYIIFICMFDPFGHDQYIYTFHNRCKEINGLELNDGRTIIFLNACGHKGDITPELKTLLDYFRTHAPQGKLASEIDKAVMSARTNAQWRREYMWLELELQNQYKKGEQSGIERGEKLGLEKSLDIMNALKSGDSVDGVAKKFHMSADEVQKVYELLNH